MAILLGSFVVYLAINGKLTRYWQYASISRADLLNEN